MIITDCIVFITKFNAFWALLVADVAGKYYECTAFNNSGAVATGAAVSFIVSFRMKWVSDQFKRYAACLSL